ncbi:flavodoxin family protein [Zongyangia hominis]|uniref:Flavodoxin family protein n=1 Tax=Zongyangia hominis TaxID=2763677 RepID=A0A926EB71_9FIRM|nr:flavodoxin family protein [Zongyangia hominis]MBC8570682.1 flavodoxin family protein [Zongyangia hominis]
MKILVLTGSPHKEGTSALLADAFIAGAREAGHEVSRFDAAFHMINPCLGCDHCMEHNGKCVYRDDMDALRRVIVDAELIAFVTPLYYFGMTAQLKRVLDRFYAFNGQLMDSPKKAVLLATGADTDPAAFGALVSHYAANCRYLGWEDAGQVLALGVGVRSDIEATHFPQAARDLGKSIK